METRSVDHVMPGVTSVDIYISIAFCPTSSKNPSSIIMKVTFGSRVDTAHMAELAIAVPPFEEKYA